MKKKIAAILLCMALITSCTACGDKKDNKTEPETIESSDIKQTDESQDEKGEAPKETISEDAENLPPASESKVDFDFTDLRGNTLYSQVFSMNLEPEKYKDKVIKIKGVFGVAPEDPTSGYPARYGVVVSDAAACCQQAVEFEWADHTYPDDYPEVGTVITVTGRYEYCKDRKYEYIKLVTDKVEWDKE